MGHIVNPIAHRLGQTRFWNSSWALSNKNPSFSFTNLQDVLIIKYLKGFLSIFLQQLFNFGLILLETKIVRFSMVSIFLLTLQFQKLNVLFILLTKAFMFVQEKVEKRNLYWYEDKYSRNGSRSDNFSRSPNTASGSLGKEKTALRPVTSTRSIAFINKKPPLMTKKKVHCLPRKFLPVFSAHRNIFLLARVIRSSVSIDVTKLFGYSMHKFVQILLFKRLTANASFSRKAKNAAFWGAKARNLNLMKFLFITRWLDCFKSLLISSLNRFWDHHHYEVILSFNSSFGITAAFVAKYISVRLLQKFPLHTLLRNVTRQLRVACKVGWIVGFKVSCSGRFARRGRAVHEWHLVNNVPKTDVNVHVDYSTMLPVLTNSICAVKVWLTRTYAPTKLFIL